MGIVVLALAASARAQSAPAPVKRGSPVVAVALPVSVLIGSVIVLSAVDQQEFDATGREKTMWQAVGWVTIGAFVAAPSLGGVYVGDWWTRGTRVRAIGLGVVAAGALIASLDRSHGGSFQLSTAETVGVVIGLGGFVTYAVGGIMEILDAARD